MAANLDLDELYILSGLLQMPSSLSHEFVSDLGHTWRWLSQAATELESWSLDEWQREYLTLFLMRGTPSSCPPYESDYCLSDHRDSTALRIAELHVLAGVPIHNMPPDYLGSELKLLAQLLDCQRDDLSPKLIDEVVERLRGWVPRFANDLQVRSRLSLYQALARRLAEIFG